MSMILSSKVSIVFKFKSVEIVCKVLEATIISITSGICNQHPLPQYYPTCHSDFMQACCDQEHM
jgi:hypothetical protein